MKKNISAKDRMISAFIELLYEKGEMETVEIKEITKKARVSPSAFFYCFKSKDILLNELNNHVWKRINDKIKNELFYELRLQKKDYQSEYRVNADNIKFHMERNIERSAYKDKDKSLLLFLKFHTIFISIIDFINTERKLSKVLFIKEVDNVYSREFLLFAKLIDTLIQEGNIEGVVFTGYVRKYLRTILVDIGKKILAVFYKGIISQKEAEDKFVDYLLSFFNIDKRLFLRNVFALNKLTILVGSYEHYTKIKSLKEKQNCCKMINRVFKEHYLTMRLIYENQKVNIIEQLQWFGNVSKAYPDLFNEDNAEIFKKGIK